MAPPLFLLRPSAGLSGANRFLVALSSLPGGPLHAPADPTSKRHTDGTVSFTAKRCSMSVRIRGSVNRSRGTPCGDRSELQLRDQLLALLI